jgi:FKBP-type peptidyl-prolyl cis-trans isomerase SlyD
MSNLTVQDGQVVSMEYTLHVDGEIIDSSDGHEPLEFLQGAGNIIPGLEDELYGMSLGETKNVVVAAEEGYGELDPDAFIDVPADQFPPEIPLEVGIELQVHDENGQAMMARIDQINGESIRLDFNHPLAGKELVFDIKIVGVRDATEEELEHGHSHNEHHHHE